MLLLAVLNAALAAFRPLKPMEKMLTVGFPSKLC
jgi:hypothetical protein